MNDRLLFRGDWYPDVHYNPDDVVMSDERAWVLMGEIYGSQAQIRPELSPQWWQLVTDD